MMLLLIFNYIITYKDYTKILATYSFAYYLFPSSHNNIVSVFDYILFIMTAK